jgi:hypothetical protein
MLSEAIVAQLPVQAREKYARLEKLFGSDGWKDIMAWAHEYADDQAQRMLTAQNWDVYLVARGANAAFRALSNLEATTLTEFEQMAAESRDEAITLDEIAHE